MAPERRCIRYVDIVIAILTMFISFAVGLVIGALTGLVALLGIGAIIVFITILVILFIIRAIMLGCMENVCCRQPDL